MQMCKLLVYDFRRIGKWDQDLQDSYLEGMRKERARAQQNRIYVLAVGS